MPQPTASDVHVNRPLTSWSSAFIQDQSDFIAGQIFPSIPSESKSDEYWIYDRGDWMRNVAEKRAAGAPSAGGGFTVTTAAFAVERYAIHQDVDDPTRANADDPLRPDRDATDWVTEQILRRLEIDWMTNFFAAGLWTVDNTPGVLWSAGGSTPIENVRAQRTAMAQLTGKRPNTIVTTPPVFDILADHPDILARISFTGGSNPAIVTEQTLAALFGVDRFLVAWGIETTSQEGAAVDTFAFIGGDNLLLAHVNPSPGPRTATAGATFVWTGLAGASPLGNRIKRFRMEDIESDRVEGEIWFDQVVISPDLGTLFVQPIV